MSGEAPVAGFEGVIYRNTGTYGSPTWAESPNVKDNKLGMEKTEGDASTRGGGGWEAIKGALKKGTVDFQLQYVKDDDGDLPDDVQAFQDSYLFDEPIECLVLDQDISVTGAEGLRATFEVLKFERDEPLDGMMVTNVSMKPTYSAHKPEWHKET